MQGYVATFRCFKPQYLHQAHQDHLDHQNLPWAMSCPVQEKDASYSPSPWVGSPTLQGNVLNKVVGNGLIRVIMHNISNKADELLQHPGGHVHHHHGGEERIRETWIIMCYCLQCFCNEDLCNTGDITQVIFFVCTRLFSL